ncbi:ABC transporter permease [Cellulomonas fimi]|uniref:Transport permease protein n=1 Tax=Cellulomonas fimi (strain ATCC 484 / DSM 20113 / JCM 1341 / CCUG 24087 / LMG 16345 / NBRC 15513 / NCIMB 8980 / NCTC 7547 / NRS-133) TaxID=590998 RepID=F4H5D2_CELFA|nr:ABC transporter permease [Cellulomonas fimi]AEE47855.1 ABC-2 type transporter [Cellulomonas fimi ATCC 484]NNH06007.1 ABC transporter permease [Cellulomonas fimi]
MSAATLAPTRTTAPSARRAGRVAQTLVVCHRWVVGTVRQPWGLGVSVLQPLVWIVLFGNVFESVASVPGFGADDYLTFLVPGVLMMTVLYSGAWAGTGFIDDIRSGVMDRLLTSPVRRSALVLGQLLQQLLVTGVQGVVVLAIAAAAGARFDGGLLGLAVALAASLLLAAAFCSLSAAVALLARDQTALIGISTTIVLPATFVSTALMPTAVLPSWVESAARYNPLTWATEIARTAMSPAVDWGLVGTRAALLTVLATAVAAWSVGAMRRYQRSL